MFDPTEIRLEFPILERRVHNQKLVYFDNAATTQKPACLLATMREAYNHYNANIHRGVHLLSQESTEHYEQARLTIANYLNAPDPRSVIFTSGATSAINMAATCIAEAFLKEGDAILVSEMEHHSNLVSWQLVAQRYKLRILKWPMNDQARLDIEVLPALLQQKVKIVAVTHVSNVTGIINPIEQIAQVVHQHNAFLFVDGAQGVKHYPIDVQTLGADFYAFSAHKVYGPLGVGILWGKYDLMQQFNPWQGGGEMVGHVSFEETTYAELPFRLEAGTPPYVEAIGLASALAFYRTLNDEYPNEICTHETILLQKAYDAVQKLGGIVYGYSPSNVAILSFNFPNVHHYDLGTLLDQMGIAVRTGTHCAEPFMNRFGITGTVRASFALYNTVEEVEYFATSLSRALEMLS